ncbi:hypothetical protein [Facklamia miroungae]|uniref:YolD-like protein n=1 Tax=Facklamia miroungae TaxID=120956 RepID=A0A1G7PTK7_9LACT|nr:hypothetical protein [Facklamia miroungae]NKZ28805.1 hypothetical protein [Facklamia miroungae]SDF88949.1 hypothetical protein SAMN05421791_101349 [Facklamia miroungae]
MELPIKKQTQWLNRISQSLFHPFFQPAPLVDEDIIMMPIGQVVKMLQDAYIKQTPLQLLIEYYLPDHSMAMTAIEAYILSPVHSQQLVSIQVGHDRFHLNINQIINVTAITETLIA